MEKLFVTYSIAILLKELGFNEPCFGYYDEDNQLMSFPKLNVFWNDNDKLSYNRSIKNIFNKNKSDKLMCLAPTWEQVEDWLRDNHNIAIIWDIQSGSSCTYNPFKKGFCFEIIKGIGNKTTSLPISNNIVHDSYYTGRMYNVLEVLEYLKKNL